MAYELYTWEPYFGCNWAIAFDESQLSSADDRKARGGAKLNDGVGNLDRDGWMDEEQSK